jgi:hypothetical protein
MTRARDVANIDGILTTKGDIYAATAASTPARLGVGSNGETIVADSSTSTGLRYTAGTVQDNPILNSAMQIAQRGTSFAIAANTMTYTLDRWLTSISNTGMTFSQQLTGDTTNLPNIQYCLRMQRNSGQTVTGLVQLAQNFETINSIPFAGKTVTVSFYARKGANYSQTNSQLGFNLYSGTGTDQNLLQSYTGIASTASGASTLTTTWQRFSYTGSIPTTSTELALYFTWAPTGTAGAADYADLTGVQIDVGSVALPFRTNAGTIQGELAACQRYYYRESGSTTLMGAPVIASSTTLADFIWQYPVTMRIAPTVSSSNNTNDFLINTAATGSNFYSSIGSFINVGVTRAQGRQTVSAYTAGQAGFLNLNQSSAFLQASAEL